MSGPKCDEIVLAEERRRKYEEALRLEKERIQKVREERRRRMEEEKRKRRETIRELDDFDAYMDSVLEQLQQEEEVAEETFEQNCQREVCMVVEETIQEMGYRIIGSKASDQSTATLYRYNDETAIQVTDANGQFTMEVVGMDVVDRAATVQEADRLARSMENFCADYKKIQRGLRENGLEVRNELFHLPSDSKYACIVNTSDFVLEKERKKGSRKVAEDYEVRQGEKAVQASQKMRE